MLVAGSTGILMYGCIAPATSLGWPVPHAGKDPTFWQRHPPQNVTCLSRNPGVSLHEEVDLGQRRCTRPTDAGGGTYI
jgi:hypothetical protein